MWTSPLELKYLLMWLLFGFIKGNKQEKCQPPPSIAFADVTAKAYAPKTKLYYECDSGYDRRSGMLLGIQCKSDQQGASWVYNKIECIDKKILLSTAPMMELEFTQQPEIKTRSPAPQKQENLSEFTQKGFCGPPRTFPHASLGPNRIYFVGQVLHFKCQSGYDKRSPTTGNSTCKEVNGRPTWTSLDMRCTNDSNQRPPLTTEPALKIWSSLWVSGRATEGEQTQLSITPTVIRLPVQSVPGTAATVCCLVFPLPSCSTYPSSSSSVTLSVTAICFVLLIIPAVFV